eukprot:gene5183-5421_t
MGHLRELHLWLGASHEFPPCSSKPLTGMLESVGQLRGLTQLQLLQGLHLSWDLRQLHHLNKLQQLQLHEVSPQLTHLGPLEGSLGAKGHGVVWDISALQGHPGLRSIGLMLGAIGSTCSCHKRVSGANHAESIATAVVRGLPGLSKLQLSKCSWLPEGGRRLSAQTCGRFGRNFAAVEVLRSA